MPDGFGAQQIRDIVGLGSNRMESRDTVRLHEIANEPAAAQLVHDIGPGASGMADRDQAVIAIAERQGRAAAGA